jgi:hypothetical protein
LEDWARLRFQVVASDPMIAIIGAVGRLTDAGIAVDDAVETVLRILHEEVTAGPKPERPSARGFVPRKASAPPRDGL